jgi:hypothetical protein
MTPEKAKYYELAGIDPSRKHTILTKEDFERLKQAGINCNIQKYEDKIRATKIEYSMSSSRRPSISNYEFYILLINYENYVYRHLLSKGREYVLIDTLKNYYPNWYTELNYYTYKFIHSDLERKLTQLRTKEYSIARKEWLAACFRAPKKTNFFGFLGFYFLFL